ncbi:MAG TPA: hypothetical protein DCM05_09090 [Elusimicrobia bacterium]|nr:hypothetical protein [Elusimicrobiota bacterium]
MRQSDEFEMALLGSCLVDHRVARVVSGSLDEKVFYHDKHALIFKAIKAIAAQHGGIVDIISVSACIRGWEKLTDIGGIEYLKALQDSVTTSAHADYYATNLKRCYFHREIESQALRIHTDPSDANIEKLEQLAVARAAETAAKYFHIKEDLPDMIAEMDAERDQPANYLDTGFKELDNTLYGIKPGNLLTIGGRPGSGKTAFCTKLALNWAKAGKRVFMFTTEMLAREMMERILPSMAGIKAWRLRRAKLEAEDYKRRDTACADLFENYDMYICGDIRPSLIEIRAAVARVKPDVLFIDNLQGCQFPDKDNRAYAIEEFLWTLKFFSAEEKFIPVLAAQLKREVDYAPKKPPRMADFRDSAAIEHVSAQVISLWDPGKEKSPKFRKVEGLILKNRNGPIGRAELIFEKDFVTFWENIEQMIVKPEDEDERKDPVAEAAGETQQELDGVGGQTA